MTACALPTNFVTYGIVFCASQFGAPNTPLTGNGWDTGLYAIRME